MSGTLQPSEPSRTAQTRSPWATYEKQVFAELQRVFPKSDINHNVRLVGRLSRRPRQIDVLITTAAPNGPIMTVVDAKCFNRRVNVTDVDQFAGFIEDVGASKGLLITNLGYSDAALRRAFYCPRDIEVDVLNFSELRDFEAVHAIPYSGDHAFFVTAPLGWVIDTEAVATGPYLAVIYQRGSNITAAFQGREVIYINCWPRKEDGPQTAEHLDTGQVRGMRAARLSVRVVRREIAKLADAPIRLRIASVKQYACLEVTGFIEFSKVIFFAVLLTVKERQRSNIRRLGSVLRQVISMDMQRDNSDLIAGLKKELEAASNTVERARLMWKIGHWYRDMKKFEEAKTWLERSESLMHGYEASRELAFVSLDLGDKDRVLAITEDLLQRDPRNPTVFNDSLEYARIGGLQREVLSKIEALRRRHNGDFLIEGNCDLYAAQLLEDPEEAKKRFQSARCLLGRVLKADHDVFRTLRRAVRDINRFPRDERQKTGKDVHHERRT